MTREMRTFLADILRDVSRKCLRAPRGADIVAVAPSAVMLILHSKSEGCHMNLELRKL